MTLKSKTRKVKKIGGSSSKKTSKQTRKVDKREEKRRIKKILDKAYIKVKTYDDLLKTGIDYLNGKLPETWWYGNAWGKGEDQKTHATSDATKTLIELHKKGVFTIGGQSSACGKLDNDIGWLGESLPAIAYEQRSSIDGYVRVELAHKLIPILKEDKRIYVDIKFPNGEGDFNNVPYKFEVKGWPKVFNVTRVKDFTGKWHEITNGYDEPHGHFVETRPREYPIIRKILKQQAEIDITLRKYCKGPEADKILLDAIRKCRA